MPGVSWKYALIVIGLIIISLLVMDFNNRMAGLKRLSAKSGEVAAQATQLRQTEMILETQIAYATSQPAVEAWAYQEGHQVRPGEVLVVPLGREGDAPEPTAAPTPTPVPQSNWEIWISLFMDNPPDFLKSQLAPVSTPLP